MIRKFGSSVAILAVALLPMPALATVSTWVNPVSGNWITPSDWSTNPIVPNDLAGGSYDAEITATGAYYTVSTGGDIIAVSTLTLNSASATLEMPSGSFTVSGPAGITAGTLLLDGGTLTTGGNFTVGSAFNFTSGTLVATGNGNVKINSGGVFNVSNTNTHFLNNVTINNSGVINIAANSSLTLSSSTINNSGYLNLNSSSISINTLLYGYTGTNSLVNTGTITVNGADRATFSVPLLNNGGTILVNGGSFQPGYGSLVFTGNSYVGGVGTFALGAPSVIQTGTLTLAAADTRLDNGTFGGNGDVILASTFDFNGGTLNGGTLGTGTLASLGSININAGVNFNVTTFNTSHGLASVTLNNSGTINLAATATLGFSNATLNNSGYINLNTSTTSYYSQLYSYTGTNSLVNTGTITTTGLGSGSISIPLLNSGGTILINSGSFALGYATTTFSGNSYIGGLGTFALNYPTVIQTGTLTLAAADTRLDNGTFGGNGDVILANTFDFNGGTLNGGLAGSGGVVIPSGSININAGVNFNVTTFNTSHGLASVTLNNSGTINLAATATLGFSNATLNNSGYINLNTSTTSYYSQLYSYTGTNSLVNTGTITTTGLGSGSISIPLLNSGGTILINSGSFALGYATTTFSGNSYIGGLGTFALNYPTVIQTGTLTLAAADTRLDNGTFGGNGDVILASTFDFNGGTLNGGTLGTGTLASLGSININAGVNFNVTTFNTSHGLASVTLNNSGTINLAATATLGFSNATLNNSGYINLNTSTTSYYSQLYSYTGTNSLVNTGTITTTGLGSGSISIPLLNSGGTILINSGSFSLGTTTFSGSSYVGGAGTFELNYPSVTQTGTLNLAAADTRFDSGSFGGSGVINISKEFDYNSGSLVGTGSLNIGSTGLFNITTFSSSHTISTTIVNNGNVGFFPNAQAMLSNGTLINNGTVLFADSGITGYTLPIYNYTGSNSFLNNGTIVAGSAGTLQLSSVALSNPGTITVTAGNVLLGSTLPQYSSGVLSGGHYVINSGGTLLLPNNQTVTQNGASVFLVGSTAAFPGINAFATNSGTFGLSSGRAFTVSSPFTNSGTLIVDSTSSLTFNSSFSNSGTLIGSATLNGAVALSGNSSVGALSGSGSANVASNSNVTATSIRLKSLTVGSNSILNIALNGGNTGASQLSSLDLSATGSRLNLNDNDLIVEPSGGVTPFNTINGYLASAYDHGMWDGNGIRSATAGASLGTIASPKTALGIGTASLVAPSGSFDGLPVSSNAIIVKYTYSGDSNLDGTVDLSDLVQVANNFGHAATWTGGDYNYDGVVDLSDLALIATNYGQPGSGNAPLISFEAALKMLGLPDPLAVPEPASLLMALPLLSLVRRRTARQTRQQSHTSANEPRASGRSAA